jgi:hypothetical protein
MGRGSGYFFRGKDSNEPGSQSRFQRSKDWDCSWFARVKAQLVMDEDQRAALQSAILLALVPPALVLAFGSALLWAFRGFR